MRPFFRVSALCAAPLGAALLLSGCTSPATPEPLVLPSATAPAPGSSTGGGSDAVPLTTPEDVESVAAQAEQFAATNAVPTIAPTSQDPSAQAGVTSGADATWTAADRQSAVDFTEDFVSAMYTSGFWVSGPAQAQWVPQTLWPYSTYVSERYWDKTIAPMLLDVDSMNENRDVLLGLAPLPPALPDGQYWSAPAVASFKFADPTFGDENGHLRIAMDYTAEAVSNDKAQTFQHMTVTGTVSLLLQKDGSSWRILEWDNPAPTFGTWKPVTIPIPRQPQIAPDRAVSVEPEAMTLEELEALANKHRVGQGE